MKKRDFASWNWKNVRIFESHDLQKLKHAGYEKKGVCFMKIEKAYVFLGVAISKSKNS